MHTLHFSSPLSGRQRLHLLLVLVLILLSLVLIPLPHHHLSRASNQAYPISPVPCCAPPSPPSHHIPSSLHTSHPSLSVRVSVPPSSTGSSQYALRANPFQPAASDRKSEPAQGTQAPARPCCSTHVGLAIHPSIHLVPCVAFPFLRSHPLNNLRFSETSLLRSIELPTSVFYDRALPRSCRILATDPGIFDDSVTSTASAVLDSPLPLPILASIPSADRNRIPLHCCENFGGNWLFVASCLFRSRILRPVWIFSNHSAAT
ncbi:hypothetical protein LY76DRAFT_152894 [Colletotrichum caudatum]|nr:hypothetical protein LY76DRAFT_152894 [Colletotrichum caudatum]